MYIKKKNDFNKHADNDFFNVFYLLIICHHHLMVNMLFLFDAKSNKLLQFIEHIDKTTNFQRKKPIISNKWVNTKTSLLKFFSYKKTTSGLFLRIWRNIIEWWVQTTSERSLYLGKHSLVRILRRRNLVEKRLTHIHIINNRTFMKSF